MSKVLGNLFSKDLTKESLDEKTISQGGTMKETLPFDGFSLIIERVMEQINDGFVTNAAILIL